MILNESQPMQTGFKARVVFAILETDMIVEFMVSYSYPNWVDEYPFRVYSGCQFHFIAGNKSSADSLEAIESGK